jgi:hypothetical protein
VNSFIDIKSRSKQDAAALLFFRSFFLDLRCDPLVFSNVVPVGTANRASGHRDGMLLTPLRTVP